MHETHLRSLLKGGTWRLAGTATTVLIALMFTGDVKISFEIGAFELISKIGLFYLHERIWLKISWGRAPSTSKTKRRFYFRVDTRVSKDVQFF